MWKVYSTIILVILVVVGGYVILKNTNKSKDPVKIAQYITTATPIIPIVTPTLTPKPTILASIKPLVNINSQSSTVTSRKIVCNYQIPPTPDKFGTASIESSWSNVGIGKNGSVKIAVCVSTDGNNKLLSTDNRTNGTRVDNTPWIALDAIYVFSLYDDRGGDLPDCGGELIASCMISTKRNIKTTPKL